MIDLSLYTGYKSLDLLGEDVKDLFLAKMDYVHEAFGDNVEYELFASQILLTPETREYLYSAPDAVTYSGGFPILEAAASEATAGCTTEREKVLGIMSYIRDLKDRAYGFDYFYGGTEEELIKKGERFCERVSRIMCVLCEISGIKARLIHHALGGHMTTEVYIEGKWGYIDPRFGLFYLDGDGAIMSVVEIMEHPEVIDAQPEWVYEYGSRESTHEYKRQQNRDIYFAKHEIQYYGEYSLADREKYHYGWMPSSAFPMPQRDAKYRVFADKRRKFLEKHNIKA